MTKIQRCDSIRESKLEISKKGGDTDHNKTGTTTGSLCCI